MLLVSLEKLTLANWNNGWKIFFDVGMAHFHSFSGANC